MADEPIPETTHLWQQAVANFGEQVVAYVLDVIPGERPDAQDDRRWAVIRSLARPMQHASLAPEREVSLRCHLLSQIVPGTDRTYLEVCRAEADGRLPVRSGEAVVDAFVRLVFNGLAMEFVPGAEWDRFAVSASFQHPILCGPATEAFLQDAHLARLFPDVSPTQDESGVVSATALLTWLPSGGGTTFLTILIGSFVEQTLARMRFLNALNEENIEAFVRESLDQLRSFARGEEVSILLLTGLIGIEVDDPLDHDTWGIRPAEGLAINEMPHAGGPRPQSVLWTKVPHRLISVSRPDVTQDEAESIFSELQEHATTFQTQLRRRTTSLQFGFLAWSVEREDVTPPNVLATASWSLIPLAQTQPPFLMTQVGHLHSTRFDTESLERVAALVEELGDVTPRLDIALSRMVRVASERRDPVDALIDAVVAWENMLGSKAETTFKVCAAIAWLLEPEDQGKRIALLSKAKKIYSLRSDLVHGSVSADASLAPEYGPEALVMAVRAFCRIHADPALKELTSSGRSELLLMRSGAR